ncbi:hypothetical protein C0J52_10537 [Blattella germanica]|nr:hypothetical protein C0J52_10537 [Blattella germanica]
MRKEYKVCFSFVLRLDSLVAPPPIKYESANSLAVSCFDAMALRIWVFSSLLALVACSPLPEPEISFGSTTPAPNIDDAHRNLSSICVSMKPAHGEAQPQATPAPFIVEVDKTKAQVDESVQDNIKTYSEITTNKNVTPRNKPSKASTSKLGIRTENQLESSSPQMLSMYSTTIVDMDITTPFPSSDVNQRPLSVFAGQVKRVAPSSSGKFINKAILSPIPRMREIPRM